MGRPDVRQVSDWLGARRVFGWGLVIAMTTRNASSMRNAASPRACATSGSSVDSNSGRYSTAIAATQAAASAAVGTIWLALTPRISPNSSE